MLGQIPYWHAWDHLIHAPLSLIGERSARLQNVLIMYTYTHGTETRAHVIIAHEGVPENLLPPGHQQFLDRFGNFLALAHLAAALLHFGGLHSCVGSETDLRFDCVVGVVNGIGSFAPMQCIK